MGRGQRHSKNAGVMGSESLSYAERKAMGIGTFKERLGKDSQGNYYDCCLTLQPAIDPVVTPEGYLYSREAILENLLAQKKAIKRKVAQWEEHQKEQERKAAEKAELEQQARLLAFDRQNHQAMSGKTAQALQRKASEEAEQMHKDKAAQSVVAIKDNEERIKTMKAYWLPSQAPQGVASTVEKPSTDTICPASGKKLRLKDLLPVRFTRVPEGESGMYLDPVTKDTLTNASRLVVLAPIGEVVLKETYKGCIQDEGTFNGQKVKAIIELRTGGTGFVAHDGDKVQAQKRFATGVGNGLADLRGQLGAAMGRSLGGLVYNN